MLSDQEHPLRPVDMTGFYLSQLNESSPVADSGAHARKSKSIAHLRRVQRANVFVRTAIRVADLFQNEKEVA
jgi:hypothetical protein